MRIFIAGSKWFGLEALRLCLREGFEVAGVIAPLDSGLYREAAEAGIPVEILGGRVKARHIPAGVDLILTAHCHAFITSGARAAAKLGALGYHPSLLPRHRGRDAVRWTIHMRDAIAGGTVFWLDDGADTGPIAAQEFCHVLPGDNAERLWRRDLAPMGIRLFDRVLLALRGGVAAASPQVEQAATWEPSFSIGRIAER